MMLFSWTPTPQPMVQISWEELQKLHGELVLLKSSPSPFLKARGLEQRILNWLHKGSLSIGVCGEEDL